MNAQDRAIVTNGQTDATLNSTALEFALVVYHAK